MANATADLPSLRRYSHTLLLGLLLLQTLQNVEGFATTGHDDLHDLHMSHSKLVHRQHSVSFIGKLVDATLQGLRSSNASNATATEFGPDNCISLSKSAEGTCVITLSCKLETDMSTLEVGFVCLNPQDVPQKALHSFGGSDFSPAETFDTAVHCSSCTSVDYALQTGGMMVQNSVVDTSQRNRLSPTVTTNTSQRNGLSKATAPTLAKAPTPDLAKAPAPGGDRGLAKAPAPKGGLAKAPAPSIAKAPAPSMPNAPQVAFFGPKSCIATYLSESGTCLIQTRCAGIDISEFGVGVTCIDRVGDYTRYVFGKGGFKDEEIFDTTLPCKTCAGVGDTPAYQLRGVLPKTMIQDLSSLKSEVKLLRSEVTRLHGNKTAQGSSTAKGKSSKKSKPQAANSSEAAVDGKQAREKSAGREAGNATNSKKTGASGNGKNSSAVQVDQPLVTGNGAGHEGLLDRGVNTAAPVLAVKKPQTLKELLKRLMKSGTSPVSSEN